MTTRSPLPRFLAWASLPALGAMLALSSMFLGGPPKPSPVYAESTPICKDWTSVHKSVCGNSADRQQWTAGNWTFLTISFFDHDPGYAAPDVDCFWFNARGYHKVGSTWDLVSSKVLPATSGACSSGGNSGDSSANYPSGVITGLGEVIMGTAGDCSTASNCYGVSRHRFEGPGSRDFYASEDSNHSCPSRWSNPPTNGNCP